MTTNFELESGKNRALVCYVSHIDADAFKDTVEAVFNNEQIALDDASGAFFLPTDDPQTALNIALSWSDTARRLLVGDNFSGVCVGVFFYDQPVPPPEPEPDPDPDEPSDAEKWREYISAYKSIVQDEDEPIPPPSITSLVCDALRENVGGVYGASAFVVPKNISSFVLEVE